MVKELFTLSKDILRGVHATVWGGVEEGAKISQAVKTGISGADVVIGTSHALEDFHCGDPICGTIDVIGSVSSAVGLVLGNIPATKPLTRVTLSITVGCRSIRYYCKNYGTFWGCVVAAGQGVKKGATIIIQNKK